MKQRKYEKISMTIFIIIIIFILELVLIYNLLNTKIIEYKKYSIYINNPNEGLVLVPIKEKEIWYKNTYIYINNKKIKYSIKEISKVDNNYQIIINFPYKNKDNNQFITISKEERRINMIEAIINSWGGDNNN